MKTYRLIVSGRVQGVSYRKFVLEVAKTLNYVGYVRNLDDGTVEVYVNADYDEDLEFFVSKLYDGSLFSHVQNIGIKEVALEFFDSFEKRF